MRRPSTSRLLQLSPLAAGALLLLVWLSVPGPLRGTMMSMAAEGVGADEDFSAYDRRTVATRWLENDAEERASAAWADTRFPEAASRTWQRLQDYLPNHEQYAETAAFALPEDSSAFEPLREFLAEFPEAEIDAYVVPRPKLDAEPVFMKGMEGILPAGALESAWRALTRTAVLPPYSPDVWRVLRTSPGPSDDYPYLDPGAWGSVVDADTGDYLTVVFGLQALPERAESRAASSGFVEQWHSGMDDWDFGSVACSACHARPGIHGIALASAGPLETTASPQFTTRKREEAFALGPKLVTWATELTQTAYVDRESVLGEPSTFPDDPNRWASVAWVTDRQGIGQTMLFVASLPEDPHADFIEWRDQGFGKRYLATRVWLAMQFPWLVTFAATLLAVSLVASPLAFAYERRTMAREQRLAELARIRQDAHDRVFNRLAALAKRVEEVSSPASADIAGQLDGVADDIRNTVTELQAILGEEPPDDSPLREEALVAHLQAIVAAQAARHQVEVTLETSGSLPSLPARFGWDLQCVLEEAITNALRHGHATQVMAALRSEGGSLLLEVSDDGVGVADSDDARPRTGLKGMQGRAEAWGGSVSLTDSEGATTLVFSIPFERLA